MLPSGNAVVEVSVETVTETESIRERRFDPDKQICPTPRRPFGSNVDRALRGADTLERHDVDAMHDHRLWNGQRRQTAQNSGLALMGVDHIRLQLSIKRAQKHDRPDIRDGVRGMYHLGQADPGHPGWQIPIPPGIKAITVNKRHAVTCGHLPAACLDRVSL